MKILSSTWSSQVIKNNNTRSNPVTQDSTICFHSPIKNGDYQISINKFGTTRQTHSPDLVENLGLNHLVFSLLKSDPFAIPKIVQKEINTNPDLLAISNEINLLKFFSFHNSAIEGKDFFQMFEDIRLIGIDEYYNLLFDKIFNGNLLGRGTRNKFGSLRNYGSISDIANNLRIIISFLLQRNDYSGEDLLSRQLITLLKVIELGLEDINHFCYRDIIAVALGNEMNFSLGNNLLSIHFVPRDVSYLTLGNVYGDCTALHRGNQIDTVKNIFWTKASWILDPFYQILEVQNHGRPILKVHLLLCVFHGKITLCVDAIETPIGMREFISNNNIKGSENKNRDPLFDYRFEILDRVISIIKGIAGDIGVETLLIEEYSNTTWVRDALQKYKQVHFYIHELREIYDGEIVDSIFYNLTGGIVLSGKKKEIQLLNSELQDKGLKNGINSARIILGSTPVIPNPFRGI